MKHGYGLELANETAYQLDAPVVDSRSPIYANGYEYYYRRGNKLFFRRGKDRLTFNSNADRSGLKRGNFYDLKIDPKA